MKLLNLGCGRSYHHEWINVNFQSTGQGVIPCNLNCGLPFSDSTFHVVYHSHLLEHFPKHYAPKFLKECFRILRTGGIIRVVIPDLERIVRLYLNLLEKAKNGDKKARQQYEWIVIEMLDQMVRDQSGGEMLNYWKQNPMPEEEFVIERCGSEVLNALAILRNPANTGIISESEQLNCQTPVRDAESIGQFRLSGEVHQWMYDRYSLSLLLENAGFKDIHPCSADESDIPNFNSYLLDIESDGAVRKPDSLFMEAKK
ncbi:methyltransferase domain-containing protein [Desulfococcaceae bacterium HSG9]|nr:methyltransferase domain-containing protein [Desulfococcaceae bacterium HSG9]